MKKHPIGRIIFSIIAVIAIIAGIYFIFEARRHRKEFYNWVKARPVDIPVDFSKPGIFTGKLHQTCEVSHGEGLWLEIDSPRLKNKNPVELGSTLKFQCIIKDQDGKEIINRNFIGKPLAGDLLENDAQLMSIKPFKNGNYNITVNIVEGINALTGVKQRLTIRYMLCGLELLPASLACIFGVVLIFCGGFIVLGVILFTRWKKKKQKV